MEKLTDTQKLIGLLLVHAVVGSLVFRYGTDLQDEGLLPARGKRLLDECSLAPRNSSDVCGET